MSGQDQRRETLRPALDRVKLPENLVVGPFLVTDLSGA